MPRRSTFDNTEILLSFSRHERPPMRDESGALLPPAYYWRCIPDLPADLTICLTDVHMIFDETDGTLVLSKNRNAGR